MDNFFDFLSAGSTIVLNLYAFSHFLAIVFTWIDADRNNAAVSFINRITHPLWRWVEAKLPVGLRLLSAFFAILLVYWLRSFAPQAFIALGDFFAGSGELPGLIASLFKIALAATVSIARSVLFFAMILCAICFFIPIIRAPMHNPVVRTIASVAEPFIALFRRFTPPARIDVAPLLAAVAAWFMDHALKYLQAEFLAYSHL